MTMNSVEFSVRDWVQIVRGEYLEIPGLQLARPQVQRLWGLESSLCADVLDTLLAERFLHRTADGRYVRMDTAEAA
jgi:hypothetical protein